jgi:hypothetical protein
VPAVEPRDFRPTAEQRRLYESDILPRLELRGQRTGRRYATEMFIVATAATSEDAELAIEDLRTKGIACLTDEGKRVEPKGNRRFTVVKFDEEKSPSHTLPCLDCDEAGCEKCGGTGRRRA